MTIDIKAEPLTERSLIGNVKINEKEIDLENESLSIEASLGQEEIVPEKNVMRVMKQSPKTNY